MIIDFLSFVTAYKAPSSIMKSSPEGESFQKTLILTSKRHDAFSNRDLFSISGRQPGATEISNIILEATWITLINK